MDICSIFRHSNRKWDEADDLRRINSLYDFLDTVLQSAHNAKYNLTVVQPDTILHTLHNTYRSSKAWNIPSDRKLDVDMPYDWLNTPTRTPTHTIRIAPISQDIDLSAPAVSIHNLNQIIPCILLALANLGPPPPIREVAWIYPSTIKEQWTIILTTFVDITTKLLPKPPESTTTPELIESLSNVPIVFLHVLYIS